MNKIIVVYAKLVFMNKLSLCCTVEHSKSAVSVLKAFCTKRNNTLYIRFNRFCDNFYTLIITLFM